MKKKIHTSVSVTAIALLLVSGCGGGGGGGGSPNAPALAASAFSTNEDTDLSGQLTATDADGDAVTFTRTSDPASGTVVSFTTAGAFVYRPNGNVTGSDSFSFRATDARGSFTNGTVTIAINPINDAPVAVNDVMRVDGTALASINVRANDTDPEGEPLTMIIEEPAVIGTASVNSDGTVQLSSLPPGFKGITRFKYRITDPNNAFTVATAAIFVGTDPFRVAFAGDEAANDAPEVFMTDFVGANWRVSAATEGNLKLRGFVASENGSTVVYRREDVTATTNTDLSFVRTAAPNNQVRITLPAGFTVASANGNDQYAVSPNGSWIAVPAVNAGGAMSLFVLNVDDAANVRSVMPPAAVYATLPRFSNDSSTVYFLASDEAGGANRNSLYRAALGPTPVAAQLSATPASNADNVFDYSVSPDQSRIVLYAKRGIKKGVYFVNPAQAGTESQLSHALVGLDDISASTVGMPAGLGGSTNLTRVAYTVSSIFSAVYVAEVSATPNPRIVASTANILGLRPDDGAVLFSRPTVTLPPVEQIHETLIDSGTPDTLVGPGSQAVFDSTGDTVVLRQPGASNTSTLTTAYRGSFGNPQQLGTVGQTVRYFGLNGVPRGVALVGEGSGSATNTRLAIVNPRAPDRLINLASFQTPLAMTSGLAYVVTY